MASRSSSSASSFDDSYFYQNYVPLSNLPTPPLMYSNTSTSRQPSESLFPNEPLSPALLGKLLLDHYFRMLISSPDLLTLLPGPATHLANLIPSSTSLITPATSVVHAILTRAALPMEMLALAACILDSLNSRFALSWRLNCPLNTPTTPSSPPQELHIDNIRPELLVLSALILSSQFLDDLSSGTKTYAADWGGGRWSCEQINFTQRSLLENIGYSLLPLCEESIIQDAVRDMERAARRSDVVLYDASKGWRSSARGSGEGTCEAVTGAGDQITPVETPILETPFSAFIPPLERFPVYVEPERKMGVRWDFYDGQVPNACG
jgi:hypothetical protein